MQKNNNKKLIYWILIAVFGLMFLVSGYIVVDYYVEYRQHQEMMEELRDLHNLVTRDPVVIPTVPTIPTESTPAGTQPVIPTVPTTSTTPTGTVPSIPVVTQPSVAPSTGGEEQPSDPVIPSTQPSIPGTSATIPTTQPTIPSTPEQTEPSLPTTPSTTVPQPTVPTTPPIVDKQILAEMQGLYELNSDVVGWIHIPNTAIDYPVMHSTIVDYYLYRNFHKQDDKRGSIYVEEHCDVFAPSDVVSLHGHHMWDGTMFNNICEFKYKSYFQSHPYVYFDTLYERHVYQVVLVFRTNGAPHETYPYFPFHIYDDFRDEEDFNDFMATARSLALQQSNVKVSYGDKLLCLSTCDYEPYPNGRMVLVCKRIS